MTTNNFDGAVLPGGFLGDLISQASAANGYETIVSGAVSLDKHSTALSVTGTVAYTLAAPTIVGAVKRITCTVAATTPAGTLTITSPHGSESAVHVFTAVGQSIELVATAALAWKMIRKVRAGVQTTVLATTVLTGRDMAAVYACSVTDTVVSTTTMALPDGTVPGEIVVVNCPTVAGTPVGSLGGTYTAIDGVAKTSLTTIGATTDIATFVWTGAAWHTMSNTGIGYS